jgi:hypothetical protein
MKKKMIFTGQTMVEFALVIPVLLLLLIGFFDLGRAVFIKSSLSNAVREGTRLGVIIGYNQGELEKIVEDNAFLINETITFNIPEPVNGVLRIKAEYCFIPITPLIGNIIPNSCAGGILLSAESAMLMEP